MRAEIIAIGDELTTGQRLDTNSQWLAERLLEIGVPVAFHTTVGDTLADNLLVFRQAAQRADIVVATGGLGPTADDLTRLALATVAGVPLVQDDASLAHIQAIFARRKREMPAANLVQAMFPQGSRAIHNPHGTAPGIDIEIPRAVGKPARIFAIPGVPAEMKEMWGATVAPAISDLLGVRRVIAHYRIKCFGVGESDLEAMLPDLIARQRYPLVGITVHQATITLRITAEGETAAAARAAMQPTIDTIHECLGDLIFGSEDDELQDVVVRLLNEREEDLALVEMGTGGLLSYWINQCQGGPDALKSGYVVNPFVLWEGIADYDESDCESFIRESLEEWEGLNATYKLVTGPFPSDKEGHGRITIALEGQGQIHFRSFPFAGHPEILRPRAAKQALNLLRLHLLGKM
jgi:nicotinamide-nucleotide amidase